MKHTLKNHKTKTLFYALTTTLLLTSCGGDNGKGKQNSDHRLINNPPVAQTQTLTPKEDAKQTITLSATDPDNDTIGYRVNKQPNHGKLTGKAPTLTYTPNKNYNGKDSFSFIANDGVEDSKEATVILNIEPVADLKALTFTVEKNRLNKDSNTAYTIEPHFDEGEITTALQERLKSIKIVSNIKDAIETNSTQKTIKVLKDGNLTLTAKLDSITSNSQTIQVYWEVNGHHLPPEPDSKRNNATLLGVDSNNNGVRDDVERFIYEKYKGKHPVNAAVAMQAAKAYHILMKNPVKAANELHDKMNAALYCEFYYSNDAKYFGEEILIPRDINTKAFRQGLIFNTKDRKDAFYLYNATLSGGAYSLPKSKELKAFCSDDVKEVMK